MSGVISSPNLPHSRGAAFTIHLILSFLIFSSLVAVMLVYWFPGDLFVMDGGLQGLKLVAMVDLVLGPALTLILFKPGKPGLKFDLSVIVTIQIAALAYGFYTTYHQRTVAVVFAEDEFATVSAQDNREADYELAKLDGVPKSLPKTGAFQVPVLLTPAPDDFGNYLQEVLNGYPAAHQRSDQYVAIADHHEQMQHARMSINKLEQAGVLTAIKNAVSARKLTMDEIEVYKFRARFADGYALYNPELARIVDYVNHTLSATTTSLAEQNN